MATIDHRLTIAALIYLHQVECSFFQSIRRDVRRNDHPSKDISLSLCYFFTLFISNNTLYKRISISPNGQRVRIDIKPEEQTQSCREITKRTIKMEIFQRRLLPTRRSDNKVLNDFFLAVDEDDEEDGWHRSFVISAVASRTGCDIWTGRVSNAELWDIDTEPLSWSTGNVLPEYRSLLPKAIDSSRLTWERADRQDKWWFSVQCTSRQYWLQ